MMPIPLSGPWLGDLHVHTYYSDSNFSPDQVVEQSRRLGLQWLSVVDHDTTAALPRLIDLASSQHLGFIPATEITARAPEGELAHIIGYGLRTDGMASLDDALAPARDGRMEMNRRSVEALRAIGYDVTWPQVLAHAGRRGVYKVHIMLAMAYAGYAAWLKGSLYKQLSGSGLPLSDRKGFVDAEDAIGLIHDRGGIAVLAHPGLHGGLGYCDQLVKLGLDGIEVYHPSHKPEAVQRALELAQQHGLAVTGGSDHHGIYGNHDITLGCPELTWSHLEELLDRIRAMGGLVVGELPAPNARQ